jgi:1,4-alpha-glucan branching enzyme
LRRAFILVTALAVGGCAAALRDGVHVRSDTVEFRLRRPEASAVAIAGDFNGWSATSHLMSREGRVWTRRIALPPGEHLFMYVVDGRDWLTPPAAAERVPDGFGGWNGRVVVP